MDFTIKSYISLIKTLKKNGYCFQTFEQYVQQPCNKTIVLRHDVDKKPKNALLFAQIQSEYEIKGTYYFRAVPESWNEKIIREISDMGHEVGYHYENLTTCKGDIDKAYDNFCFNLKKLRKLVDVKTICMHGSPASPYDSKDIWKKYDYKKLGIIAEPYFDIDFNNIFYLTDTGRRWDGFKVSVRDKVPQQDKWNKQGLIFHTTKNIITATNNQKLPHNIMFTMHPQRWESKPCLWFKELLLQNAKNMVKRLLFVSS